MRYRIKIVTYKNGRKEYTPQFRQWGTWDDINWEGEASVMYETKLDSRQDALDKIDLHYAGNKKKQTIEFEYITK